MGAVIRLPSSWYPKDSVDEWGRDAQLIERLTPFAAMRWSVLVEGAHRLPKRAGALLVTNSWRFALNTVYSAWALSDATGRPVRFGGRPDVAPFGPVMQRVGGLLGLPEEIRGALRAGELVIVSTASTGWPRRAGAVDPALVAVAVSTGSPIYPVASISTPFGRAARVEVGPQVRTRQGIVDDVELAESVQRQVQRMIDGIGET